LGEFDAVLFQKAVCAFNIVDLERHVLEGANPILVPVGGEERESRLRPWYFQLDPALPISHRLVGGNLQAEFLRPEGEGLVLISHRNAHELDSLQHDALLL